jgi:hypothetical protein
MAAPANYDGDELREVRAIRDKATADGSKKVYLNSIYLFLEYAAKEKPEWLTPSFFEAVKPALEDENGDLRGKISEYIVNSDQDPMKFPLDFDEFSKDELQCYLLSRKKGAISASYLNNIRSGIRHLFVIYDKLAIWEGYKESLTLFMKGAKNDIAKMKQQGGMKVKEGKEPMPYSLYLFFGAHTLSMPGNDAIFARLFMILSWNLMCRSHNTEGICLSHMKWISDAVGFVFGQQKNDQEGEDHDYRHVYANPTAPEICPILALGIYLLCEPPFCESSANQLFPGSKQAARYGKFMRDIMAGETVAEKLRQMSLKSSDLGTHSARKGAATYCCNGTTDAPSIAAIHLRGGWRLEGVTHRYIRFDGAMDQKVGRTVTGLPVMSPKFALLPPFFVGNCDAVVSQAVAKCFPNAPDMLQSTLPMCLASVVYHSDFLQHHLPADHPLFATPVFRAEILGQLKSFVVCRNFMDGDQIKPTGLSPASAIIADLDAIKQSLFDWRAELIKGMEQMVIKTVDGITKVLEDRAVGVNTVTTAGLQSTLEITLAPYNQKIDRLFARLENQDQQAIPNSALPGPRFT